MNTPRPPVPPPPAPRVPPPPPPARSGGSSSAPETAPLAPPPAARRPPAPPPPPAGGRPSAPTDTMVMPGAVPSRPAAPPPPRASAPPPPARPPAPGGGPVRPRVASGSPTLMQLVKEAFDKGFSDVHLGVNEVPRFRNRGEMDMTNYPVTDEATFMSWLQEILTEEEIKRFQDKLDFDGAAQFDFTRVRINVFDTLRGPAIVMRLIPTRIMTLEELNLPQVFRDVCHYHKGLILVTGPTGSGKSTTMAAMVDYINSTMPKHIISIEDPVEFVHTSRKALVKQREVGMHTLKFDNALKASLREDPDIILIGEMRDIETVNTALKASQTGHLVMGTLHTNSAVKTIERILQLYEPQQQEAMRFSIAESLVAVIAQGLCRTTDGKRAAFHEILINTDAIKDYIQRNQMDEVEALLARSTFDGMCTMNQSLYNLYEAGRITEEVALEMSPKPNEMAQILRGRV